ncbi:hypothetical protein F4806DRAFT_471927 [Annulohypoxylon nitens]|nr:hypothetical protein F4806DRAFT_471927 [Annulohypoxylon nitens]
MTRLRLLDGLFLSILIYFHFHSGDLRHFDSSQIETAEPARARLWFNVYRARFRFLTNVLKTWKGIPYIPYYAHLTYAYYFRI